MNESSQKNVERFTLRADIYKGGLTEIETEHLRRVAEKVHFGPGQWLLDVGAGTGNSALPFLRAGGKALGVEITPAMARKGISRLGEEGLGGKLCYAISSAERPPVRGNSVDCAICRYVFHHLAEPARVLQEMARAVRPGGSVVVVDFYVPDEAGERERIDEVERVREPSHERLLSLADFRSMYAAAGLDVVEVEERSRRQPIREWLESSTASAEETEWIRGALAEMRDAGGGWLEVRGEGEEMSQARKWVVVIGRKR